MLTGGRIEKGETARKAAIREAEEETGFRVKLVRKIGVYHILNKRSELVRKTYFFEGRRVSGEFKPEYPGCKGQWFIVNNLPVDLTLRTKQKILDAVNFSGKPFVKVVRRELLLNNFPLLLRHPMAAIKYIHDKYL